MKKLLLRLSKISGIVIVYFLILFASTFFTMSFLIKGEEINAPDMIGRNLNEAYSLASKNGFFLKKVTGNYSRNFKPLTVIDQIPEPGVKIKLKSFVKIFITPEMTEVIVPDLSGYRLEESKKLIKESELVKRHVSYISSEIVPSNFIISQSLEAGSKVPINSEIDILVSKGKREKSFIMPDIIGKKAGKVLTFFERLGLRIENITKVAYPGLDSDIIIRQKPAPGFKISSKNRISIQVSE